jgi:conjugative transposon TraM protein
MKTKTMSPQSLRKRKFLMVLPLLVLPFVTLLFWSLGGGNTNEVQAQPTSAKPGLNMELPDVHLKDDKPLDKLSYYEKAASDSAKLEEQMKNDPYYLQTKNREGNGTYMADSIPASIKDHPKNAYGSSNLNTSPYGNHYQDPNEAKVYSKLQELDKAMNQASVKSEAKSGTFLTKRRDGSSSINSLDIDRLEQMMATNKQEDAGGGDSEMNQLNGIMERILDIQHPERVKERIQQASETHKGQVFAVNVNSNIDSNSLLTSNTSATQVKLLSTRFYSLDADIDTNLTDENAIKAVVHETQILVGGSVVKLRLLNDVFINGNLIPKDNFVFGIATLIGERLIIKINSIRYNNSLYPVDLSVSDMDGIDGIYIPGAITRDVAKQSADRAIQGIGLTTIDPSFKLQATTAGIEAAKTLFSRKAKLIKVTVKAGYQVLLKDEKQKTSF